MTTGKHLQDTAGQLTYELTVLQIPRTKSVQAQTKPNLSVEREIGLTNPLLSMKQLAVIIFVERKDNTSKSVGLEK